MHDPFDGLPGLAVDVYGTHALVHLYDPEWDSRVEAVAAALLALGIVRGVYATVRPKGGTGATGRFVAGERAPEDRTEIREHGLTIEIHLAEGPATGLYMDQRANHRALAERLAAVPGGGTLLNTFCFTAVFSLVAAARGTKTTNVDLARGALEQGKRNFERNGIPLADQSIIADDVFLVLPRLVRRGNRYDAVLLDPPTFARGKRGTFSTERDYAQLVAQAAPLVAPGGLLVAFANTHRMTRPQWLAQVRRGLGAASAEFREVDRWTQDVDFPVRGEAERYLKGVVLQRTDPAGPR